MTPTPEDLAAWEAMRDAEVGRALLPVPEHPMFAGEDAARPFLPDDEEGQP